MPTTAVRGRKPAREQEPDEQVMRLTETALGDAFLIEPEPASEAGGFFARTFCHAGSSNGVDSTTAHKLR